jgi:hypothetical protein
MSDGAGITQKGNGLDRLKQLLSNAKNTKAALASTYDLYQRLQIQPFMTNNASEGDTWADLSPEYKKYKPRRYGGGPRRKSKKRAAGQWNTYPFRGAQMLVGTSGLGGAVVGPNSASPFLSSAGHSALFTSRQMVINVNESGQNPDGDPFDYPHFVNQKRNFMSFGPTSIGLMQQQIASKLLAGL